MTNSNNKNMEDYNKKDVAFTEGLKPMPTKSEYDGDTLNTLSPVRRKKKSSLAIQRHIRGIITSHLNDKQTPVKKPREIFEVLGSTAFPSMNTEWEGFNIVIVVSPNGTKFVARNRYGESGVYLSDGELTKLISSTKDSILIVPFEKAVGKNK